MWALEDLLGTEDGFNLIFGVLHCYNYSRDFFAKCSF